MAVAERSWNSENPLAQKRLSGVAENENFRQIKLTALVEN